MTAVPIKDAYGNPVSSVSRAAVDAYDRGVRGLLGFSANIIDSFRADADRFMVAVRNYLENWSEEIG